MPSSLVSRVRSWCFRTWERPRQRRRFSLTGERLEVRTLLDGNVTAVVANGTLTIDGDAADNTVEVAIESGDVVVRGLDGTTVNGSEDPFVAFSDTETITTDLRVNLGRGNDVAAVSDGVVVGRDLNLRDRRGANQLGLLNAQVTRNLRATTGHADDGVNLVGTTIGGSLLLNTRRGNDVVSILTSDIGRTMRVATGRGTDSLVVEESQVGRNASINTGKGHDAIAMIDSSVSRNLRATTGSGRDFLMLDSTDIGGKTRAMLQRGSDILLTEGTTQFGGRFVGIASQGNDLRQFSAETTFGRRQRTVGFERSNVPQTAIDDRLTSATGAVTRADELRGVFGNLLLDPLALTTDTSSNAQTLPSNGTLATKLDTLTIEGTTVANGLIEVDADGDGAFDDGTAQADANGDYAVDAALAEGRHEVQVRVTDSTGRRGMEMIDVHRAIGSVVRFHTQLGTYDVEMLDADTPLSVANFFNYLERFEDSIIHRSPDGFVIQGGGFDFDGEEIVPINVDGPIDSEFDPANSNVRGTISMAHAGDPDGATSQWFVNVGDNTSLDNVPHTVFGFVIGDGMDVVDAINDIPIFDMNPEFGGAVGELPLRDYQEFSVDLAGTVSIDAGGTTLVGTQTAFLTELEVGDKIQVGDEQFFVRSIQDDETLTLNTPHTIGVANLNAQKNSPFNEDNLVQFDAIEEILTT